MMGRNRCAEKVAKLMAWNQLKKRQNGWRKRDTDESSWEVLEVLDWMKKRRTRRNQEQMEGKIPHKGPREGRRYMLLTLIVDGQYMVGGEEKHGIVRTVKVSRFRFAKVAPNAALKSTLETMAHVQHCNSGRKEEHGTLHRKSSPHAPLNRDSWIEQQQRRNWKDGERNFSIRQLFSDSVLY